MKILERQLEDIVFESDSDILNGRGLGVHEKRIRQLRVGNYGICDMVAYQKQSHPFLKNILSIQVIELKQHDISLATFNQALKYVKGITRYLDKYKPDLRYTISIVLIGRKLYNDDSLMYLPELFEKHDDTLFGINGIYLYTYNYSIEGIEFKHHHGYCLTNEGF